MTEPTRTDGLRRGCGTLDAYARMRREAFTICLTEADPAARLAPVCDLIWNELSTRGLSWIGFYLASEEAPPDPLSRRGELVLAARRDKPACSPIGLHGVCGQSFLEESVRLVEDVALLGAGYIACDPRDRSEIVVPIYRNGRCWGVLDADSHEAACFGPADIDGLCGLLRSAELLDRDPPVRADRLHLSRGSL